MLELVYDALFEGIVPHVQDILQSKQVDHKLPDH
jgi:hypothetical protein